MSKILQFGKYNQTGKTLQEIYEKDKFYVAYLTTLETKKTTDDAKFTIQKHIHEIVQEAKTIATEDDIKSYKKFIEEKNAEHDVEWLLKCLKHTYLSTTSPWMETFCDNEYKSLSKTKRLDAFTFKKLKMLMKIWSINFGEIGSEEYKNAQLYFISKFDKIWIRKTKTLKDLLNTKPVLTLCCQHDKNHFVL